MGTKPFQVLQPVSQLYSGPSPDGPTQTHVVWGKTRGTREVHTPKWIHDWHLVDMVPMGWWSLRSSVLWGVHATSSPPWTSGEHLLASSRTSSVESHRTEPWKTEGPKNADWYSRITSSKHHPNKNEIRQKCQETSCMDKKFLRNLRAKFKKLSEEANFFNHGRKTKNATHNNYFFYSIFLLLLNSGSL